ncbi:EGF-like domain-containing protein 2 [Littorina saxatilis]|uniref:Uncharacterized protein n=1 Tax=Littorina saxatilis TaxID=31220 RepID=A0AAN9AMG9_9CAEN
MTQYTSLFVLLVALSGALSQTPPTGNFFDCRREGITCTDGTCDAVGTTCTCDAATFTSLLAYHCVDNAVATTTCTNPALCLNGGECRVVGVTDTCFCPQLYTGTTCELPRIELTCDSTAMTVTVRPHGSFAGAMYAKGQASDTNCVLAASGTDYVKAFDYTVAPGAVTNCGVVQGDLEDPPGTVIGTKYTLNVIVQYEITPDIVMGTDQELVATCSFPESATATGVIFESDATGNLDLGTGDAEGSPLVFDILGNDGTTSLTAAQTVNVGEELTVTILLQTNPTYPEFLIESCTAANGDDDTATDYDSLDFVTTGGCPTDNQVVRGVHTSEIVATGDTGTLVKIPLYAFMFVKGSTDNKNTLYFSCSVTLCDAAAVAASTCNAPDPATCTGDFPAGLGKRRRRAADGDTRVVGQALTVRFGNATLEEEFRESSGSEQTGVETDTAKCLKNPELQTVISVLGIFLLALLIALIVVTFLFCRRSRHTQGKYVDDGHTMGSSTQTLNMHIPRPRV